MFRFWPRRTPAPPADWDARIDNVRETAFEIGLGSLAAPAMQQRLEMLSIDSRAVYAFANRTEALTGIPCLEVRSEDGQSWQLHDPMLNVCYVSPNGARLSAEALAATDLQWATPVNRTRRGWAATGTRHLREAACFAVVLIPRENLIVHRADALPELIAAARAHAESFTPGGAYVVRRAEGDLPSDRQGVLAAV